MKLTKEIQIQHEKAVCENLLAALEIEFTYVRHGDDKGEPDIIFSSSENKTLGIEVATAYFEDCDAKAEWECARGERDGFTSWEIRKGAPIEGPDKRICERIQNELFDKCSKTYVGADELWLCIDTVTHMSSLESTEECVHNLIVPQQHCFERIYVVFHFGGFPYPYQVFPMPQPYLEEALLVSDHL